MAIKVIPLELPEVLLVEPDIYRDARGFFKELFHSGRYEAAGLPDKFVQDNYSFSSPGVLRGMHLQLSRPQGKLISAVEGEIFDVAVDVRHGSPTFGRWCGEILSAENHRQLFIPEVFGHGFVVLGDSPAGILYKCTALYDPASEIGVRWNDPDIAIDWPRVLPTLNARDAEFPFLGQVPVQNLPVYG